jgi:urease
MFGGNASCLSMNCLVFVSQESIKNGTVSEYKLRKRIEQVKGCASVTKKDMKWNDATPDVQVDPETYVVTVDGHAVSVEPAKEVCMAQNMFLF